ncbi:tyrosine-protein phosphatase non-receptor type substrate 1-like [Bombina bombina]|uniref:tyrosine-protein phosphatase non-receptor type substrate 1-like n=1 Tax=Bombina bombina TaxID=8345 RepID=UPI00235A8F81|nr:tyrosine-protein phosphatase non-receptor type substrate 1-like [Bombina bombina]
MMSALLLIPLLPITLVCAQLQVTTSSSPVIAHAGNTALLHCNFTLGVSPVDPAQVHVVWKNDGKKVLAYTGEITVFRHGAQFSEERLAQGDASLTINNVTEADGGKYTCNVRLASEQETQSITLIVKDHRQIWVEGTMVIMNQSNELRCWAGNLSSSEVTFEWTRNGHVLSIATPRVLEDVLGQGFMVESSFCFTPTTEDEQAQYSCQVRQKSLPLLKKTFRLTFGVRPEITFLIVDKSQKNSSLVCIVSGFYPNDLSITLQRNGEILGEHTKKWLNANGTFSLIAIYPFKVTVKDDNVVFSCTVRHPTIPGGVTERLRFLVDPYVPQAFWVIAAVSFLSTIGIPLLCKHVSDISVCKDWTDGCIAVLKCHIAGRYPKTITALWLVRKGEKEIEIKERGSLHPIGDYRELQEQDSYTCWNTVRSTSACGLRHSLSSVLCFQVNKEQHDKAEFICRFMRADKILAEKQFSGNVLDNYGFYSASDVSVPELCDEGEKVTLSCFMRGNVPRDIRVMWEKCLNNERAVYSKEDENYQITENKSGGKFYSFLTFIPSLDDSGAVFTCSFSENEGRILAVRHSQALTVAEPKKNTWSRTYQDWGFRAFDESAITEM